MTERRSQLSDCKVTSGRQLSLPPLELIYIYLNIQISPPNVQSSEDTKDDKTKEAKTPPGHQAEPRRKQQPGRAEKHSGH